MTKKIKRKYYTINTSSRAFSTHGAAATACCTLSAFKSLHVTVLYEDNSVCKGKGEFDYVPRATFYRSKEVNHMNAFGICLVSRRGIEDRMGHTYVSYKMKRLCQIKYARTKK